MIYECGRVVIENVLEYNINGIKVDNKKKEREVIYFPFSIIVGVQRRPNFLISTKN